MDCRGSGIIEEPDYSPLRHLPAAISTASAPSRTEVAASSSKPNSRHRLLESSAPASDQCWISRCNSRPHGNAGLANRASTSDRSFRSQAELRSSTVFSNVSTRANSQSLSSLPECHCCSRWPIAGYLPLFLRDGALPKSERLWTPLLRYIASLKRDLIEIKKPAPHAASRPDLPAARRHSLDCHFPSEAAFFRLKNDAASHRQGSRPLEPAESDAYAPALKAGDHARALLLFSAQAPAHLGGVSGPVAQPDRATVS